MPNELPIDGGARLERWSARHIDGLVEAINASRDELRTWFAWADHPATTEEQRARLDSIEEGDTEYVLVDDGDDDRDVIGSIRVHPMGDTAGLGYWLRTDRTGRGLMTRAVETVGEVAVARLGVTAIEIHCDEANDRSAAIPRRLGYTLVDRIERPVEAPGHTGVGLVWRLSAPGP